MNEQMDVAQATSIDEDRARLDRRTAMRAALGGAAAGAAFMAPRIDGLSVAPDYAAAATACTIGAAGTSVTVNGNSAKRTPCWGSRYFALCFGGTPTFNGSGCGGAWNCGNTGNWASGDANGATNGIALNLAGSQLRYAIAGSTKQIGSSGIAKNWTNDSRSHMKINTVASPFNSCSATMSLTCKSGAGAHFRDVGNDNGNNGLNVNNTNDPASWTRTSSFNSTNAWNTRWIIACSSFENNSYSYNNNGNGTELSTSTIVINFTCSCNA
ncbi:MAG: hypothetical protein M9952_04675 [Microthrixaceae bacterium]|nr:hypothetical protein [Microthrixaceae bacterium]